LLADEPTTALDVTIQAQIMDVLNKINREHGTSIILVTHNLGLVAEFCENIIVMYAGWMMEKGSMDAVIEDPRHPYTAGLLRCLPRISEKREKILPIPGLVPDLAALPPGCPFSPRCDRARPKCSEDNEIPAMELDRGRLVRCLYPLRPRGG
jgi:oligopeptide/dipeptide ABC transporter ATP-binding protein